jgi:hypothetical protein
MGQVGGATGQGLKLWKINKIMNNQNSKKYLLQF